MLRGGVVAAQPTVPYPSDHVTVRLGRVGDTVKLLLIHHTNPACGGFGELYVFGGAVAPSPPPAPARGAQTAADAEAIVKAVLDKQKSSCSMTYSSVTATAVAGGWNVLANVVTSGNPGTAKFGVATGGTTATPADPLSADIDAGVRSYRGGAMVPRRPRR